MNRQQTLQMVVALSQGFSRKLEKATIEHYVETLCLDKLTVDEAQEAVRHILRDEERFPSIAKIREYFRMHRRQENRSLEVRVRPAAADGVRMARASKVASRLGAVGYGVRWITEQGLEEISEPDEGFSYVDVDWRDDDLLESLTALADL